MEPKKILLIDDELDVLRTSVILLEMAGFKVVTATDGIDGLRKARAENPDLIILDVMLPNLDGYKICRILKFDEKYKQIPIIMLTARAQESDKKMSKEVCADVHITKPFSPDELIKKIHELLKAKDNKIH
jgi:DNA-binding response OmpR family regulator